MSSSKLLNCTLFAAAVLIGDSTYAQVSVRVENHPTRAEVKFVKFYSERLARETTTRVFLPPNYDADGEPLPTLYLLHGTCSIATLDKISTSGTPIPDPAYPFGPCFSGVDSEPEPWMDEPAYGVSSLIVYPDTGGREVWCGHCWWVNGRNGKGVAAESHLYEELIPAIERTFNVRRDRNGRALAGKSMGADGTLANAFRHPDWWRFALALSPTDPGESETLKPIVKLNSAFAWAWYLSDQGYDDPAKDEVHYENIEPVFIAQNAVGTGLEVIVNIGNGCAPPENNEPACSGGPQRDEAGFRAAKDVWSTSITERGVDLTYIVRQGNHGTGIAQSYLRLLKDRVARMFATPAPTPAVFSYSTVDTDFSVWGWRFSVARPNDEFLHLSGARTDGRAITLAGTGSVTLTTPPLCSAEGLRALATADGVEGDTVIPAELVDGNRLRLTVNLGARDPAVNQRRELVESGKFNFPRTRVRLMESAAAAIVPFGQPKKKPSNAECS